MKASSLDTLLDRYSVALRAESSAVESTDPRRAVTLTKLAGLCSVGRFLFASVASAFTAPPAPDPDPATPSPVAPTPPMPVATAPDPDQAADFTRAARARLDVMRAARHGIMASHEAAAVQLAAAARERLASEMDRVRDEAETALARELHTLNQATTARLETVGEFLRDIGSELAAHAARLEPVAPAAAAEI